MSNIIIQGNEINAKQYVEKVTIEGVGEEKSLNPRLILAKNNMIKYSTEEQVIGTWIDGKPLYQKSFKITQLPSSTYNDGEDSGYKYFNPTSEIVSDGYYQKNYDIAISLNIDLIANIDSVYYEKDNDNKINPRYISLNARPVDAVKEYPFGFFNSNGRLVLRVARSQSFSNFVYLIITIQYTKTTD